MLGAQDKEIAEHFLVSPPTLVRWKREHPELAEAIRRGRANASANVAYALYNRAMGAHWSEQQAVKIKEVTYDSNGRRLREVERVEVVEVKRGAPPDTLACIFWLKNKDPEHWRDRTVKEITGGDQPVQIDVRALQDLVRRRNEAARELPPIDAAR